MFVVVMLDYYEIDITLFSSIVYKVPDLIRNAPLQY